MTAAQILGVVVLVVSMGGFFAWLGHDDWSAFFQALGISLALTVVVALGSALAVGAIR
jgi:hypothetical protein